MTRVESFGCRLNLAEGATLARLLDDPGLVVINSCAVTSEAVRQSAQAVRRAARTGARVVVAGCAAEVEPGAFAGFATVGRLRRFEAAAYSPLPPGERSEPIAGRAGVGDGAARTRAFVPVQTGCDHACTFCIIARARGPSVSTPASAVVEGVARLVAAGCAEVVLTGVDLTSYADAGHGLGQLVERILTETDLPRLRLSSIDSIEADDRLLAAIAEQPRLMPQLHLSLQSGDDLILKRMRRRHSRADAVRFCAELARARPGLAFAADLIAGFPTETEAMFERTLALVDDCGLGQLHVFPYSPRPGTPAARMPQVAPAVARERGARLRARGAERTAAALGAEVGRPQRVLVERSGRRGRTEHYLPAAVPPSPPGSIVTVTGRAVAGDLLECA